MSRRRAASLALLLVVAGAAGLAWGLATAADVDRPAAVGTRALADAYTSAAELAFGRRVLVVHAPPLAQPHAEVLESVESAGGWGLFRGVPPGAGALEASLADAADRAAAQWAADATFGGELPAELAALGVAIVLIDNGAAPITPRDDASGPGLDPEPRIPGLRVPGAELVRTAGSDGTQRAADISDPRDLAWGGEVTVDVPVAGEFTFIWPAGGARVTVDGAPAEGRADALGRLVLDLPSGRPRVRVEFGEGGGRGLVLSGAAFALIIGIVLLLRAVRPQLEHDGGDDDLPPSIDAPAAAGGASA